MAENERTSPYIASLASRGLKYGSASLSLDEFRAVCASCLTQAPDKPAPGAHAYYNGLTPPEQPNLSATLASLPCVPQNKLAGELSKLLADTDMGPLALFRTTEPSA